MWYHCRKDACGDRCDDGEGVEEEISDARISESRPPSGPALIIDGLCVGRSVTIPVTFEIPAIEAQVATIMAQIAAVVPKIVAVPIRSVARDVAAIGPNILPVMTHIHTVVARIAAVEPALGLGSNAEEETGGEEDRNLFHFSRL